MNTNKLRIQPYKNKIINTPKGKMTQQEWEEMNALEQARLITDTEE